MKLPFLTAGLSIVLFSLAGAAEAPSTNSLTIEPCWPEIPAPAVDLFIPPTRTREPFVATTDRVFRIDEDQQRWTPVYTVAPPSTSIVGIQGYAKASPVLYVAHTRGVARTKDGGETWIEAAPPDFSLTPETFTGLAVNPTNRRQVVVGTSSGLWFSSDYGESYAQLRLPAGARPVLDTAYGGAEHPGLVVLTDRALLLTEDNGETWESLPLPGTGTPHLAASPTLPGVLVGGASSPWVAYDLSRPGHRRLLEPLDLRPADRLALDQQGQDLIWMSSGTELSVAATQGNQVRLLASRNTGSSVRLVRSHPRSADQLFFVGTTQVYLARFGLTPAVTPLTNLWDLATFQPGPVEESRPVVPTTASAPPLDVPEALRRLAANEPPLTQVLNTALAHAGYNPNEIDRWKRRARSRNWVPQLRVGTGARQLPMDDSAIYSYVDRYGIPRSDDLNLPDQAEWMGYVGVTLVWDFPRLLFDPEEADINKEKRYEIKQRNDLVSQVTSLYHERLELLLRQRARTDRMSLDERITAAVKLRQKSELLNQLCGRPLFEISGPP